MSYLSIPLQINAEALITEVFERMEAQFPGWKAKPGNLETVMIRSIVYVLIQPLAQLASDVADEIFNRYGEQIVKVQPHEQTRAAGKVEITFKDSAGYELPAGYEINVPKSGSNLQAFRTTAGVAVPAGSTTATEVPIEAIEPGPEGNHLIGTAQPVDTISYVVGIKVTTETSGGEEAEEPTAYLSRLVEVMQTLAPRPIIARDVAILARTIPGVQRAAVKDNYNAETQATGQEKTTTVAVANAEGKAVSAEVKAAVKAMLAAKREANFIFFVVDPNEEPVDVKAALVEAAGFSHAEAVGQAESAIRRLLNPAVWGTGLRQEPSIWENVAILRFQDVVTAINNCQAVDHYTSLEIRRHSGAYGTADVAFTGVFPLPKVETLAIT